MSTLPRLTSVLLVLGLSTFLLGQGAPQAAPTTVSGPDTYSQEAFVLEQMAAKLAFESDGTSTREDFGRIRIQSDAGVRTYQVLTFPYANSESTLQIDFVRVRKNDGTEVDTPLENIQDMPSEITRQAPFYSDVREKHVAVKGLGTGDVLEFKTHLTSTKPLAAGKFWFAYNFTDSVISLDEHLEISVPSKSEIKIASAKVKPDISESGKYRIYRWHYSNLHQKPKEDQQLATYNQARGRLPEPDVQISNFQTWDEVGRWYNDLQRDRVKPTPEIQAKAAQLTKDAPDDTAKLQAIYKYVSTEFHYIGIAFGIGRYQPHAASEVLANQYGDCKDKHTLLASLLTAAGFKVYPALISSSHEIDPDVPSPGQFDHVITVVQRGNDLLWLDSTPEVAPFGYLISPLWGKHALVMFGDKAASLVMTPAVPPVKATSLFEIKATLADTGVLDGEIERSRSNDDFEIVFRSAFRRTPFPQWKDLIQQISYASGFAGDVSEVTASSPEAIDKPFKFSYKYSRKDYPDWANRRIDPPLPPVGLPTLPDDGKKLSAPLWLGAPGEHKYISEVGLPKGYRPELPGIVDLKTDFADYHASTVNTGGKLITTRILTIKLAEVPTKNDDEYKTFKKVTDDDHDGEISLLNGSDMAPVEYLQNLTASLPNSKDPEAIRVFQDAGEALQKHDTTIEIADLRRAVEIDPKFIRAWVWLASAYLADLQISLGLDALHKAINTDPNQPAAYSMLALQLAKTGDYEKAIPVWKKLIAIAPQDSDAAINLGDAYLRFKNYGDARSAFELALKYQPDMPSLLVDLGISYLNTGSEREAFDAFKKAIALNSSANTLNSVAYELADANKELPEALKYAEKAVHDVETESNKIDLNTLKVEDLQSPPTLAACWDTLGWVYFRLKDYEKAERYVDASWHLSLGGLQADHLGQVYESQHKATEAIQMYRAAIAVGSPKLQPGLDLPKIKERLTRLGGSPSPSDNVYEMYKFKLPHLISGRGMADFFLLFSPQTKPPGFKTDGVRFISGTEELRPVSKELSAFDYKVRFPDDRPAHIIRRGTLSCDPFYAGCSLVMLPVLLPPETVNSIY